MNIRPETLTEAEHWEMPTGAEIRAVIAAVGLSGSGVSRVLGLGSGGGRTVRRWVAGESPIPYAAWALLCEMAGLGRIWRGETPTL